MAPLPSTSLLVRTWFEADDAWEHLVAQVQTPTEDGFLAVVALINDPAHSGMTAEVLKVEQPGGAIVSFLADKTTLARDDHPILAVWVLPRQPGDDRPEYTPFRVVASQLPSVENNINLANLDWGDFTRSLDDDGVFRGF